MSRMRWRRRSLRPDPGTLGNLTLWEAADDRVIWAEWTKDPRSAKAVEQVKQTFRERGWTQIAGD